MTYFEACVDTYAQGEEAECRLINSVLYMPQFKPKIGTSCNGIWKEPMDWH